MKKVIYVDPKSLFARLLQGCKLELELEELGNFGRTRTRKIKISELELELELEKSCGV